jgi:excisionase family DNA binding protein
MIQELKENNIYTTEETRTLLKISDSTMKRLLKKGLIKANKIGRQYRILGREILHLVSPVAEKEAIKSYLNLKQKVKTKIKKW